MQGLSERLNSKIDGLLEQNATLEAQNAQLKSGIESLSKNQHELNETCVQRVQGWGDANRAIQGDVQQLLEASRASSAHTISLDGEFNGHAADLGAQTEAWGQSNRDVAATVNECMGANDALQTDVGNMRAATEASVASLTADAEAWGESNKKVIGMIVEMDTASAAIKGRTTDLSTDIVPLQEDAVARTAEWETNENEVCASLRATSVASEECSANVRASTETFSDTADAFAADFAPKHEDAVARTAEWEASDAAAVADLRTQVAANGECDANVGESLAAFTTAADAFATDFAPQQADAVARTAEWEASDAAAVADLRTQVAANGECDANVGEALAAFSTAATALATDFAPQHADAGKATADWEANDTDVCDILRAAVKANDTTNSQMVDNLEHFATSASDALAQTEALAGATAATDASVQALAGASGEASAKLAASGEAFAGLVAEATAETVAWQAAQAAAVATEQAELETSAMAPRVQVMADMDATGGETKAKVQALVALVQAQLDEHGAAAKESLEKHAAEWGESSAQQQATCGEVATALGARIEAISAEAEKQNHYVHATAASHSEMVSSHREELAKGSVEQQARIAKVGDDVAKLCARPEAEMETTMAAAATEQHEVEVGGAPAGAIDDASQDTHALECEGSDEAEGAEETTAEAATPPRPPSPKAAMANTSPLSPIPVNTSTGEAAAPPPAKPAEKGGLTAGQKAAQEGSENGANAAKPSASKTSTGLRKPSGLKAPGGRPSAIPRAGARS